MINWILENKEWLFSGIGVTVILGIFYLVRKFVYGSKTPPTPEPKKFIELDLPKIIEKIESLPPYQREDARKHYIGVRFRYTGRLFSAEKQGKRKVRFTLESLNVTRSLLIFGTVSENRNPQLKIAHKGTRITVGGDLADLDSNSATIENIEILAYEEEKGHNH